MKHLVFISHDQQNLMPGVLNTLAAPMSLGGEIDAVILGQNCSAVTAAVSNISGLNVVKVCDDDLYSGIVAEDCAAILQTIADEYSHIWFTADTIGKNIAPRLAALRDVQQISEIIEVKDAETFVRPIYAGNAIATVKSTQAQNIITVRGTAFEPVATEGGSASVAEMACIGDANLSRYLGAETSSNERPELSSAKIVISGGRGMQSGDNFPMLEKIADKLGAAVGASRAAVDEGFVTNDYQVGQTGKVVAPDLYIAVGISGAIQHLAGMKDSKCIVAINKDEDAPIFQVADYGLVADLFDALPELDAALE